MHPEGKLLAERYANEGLTFGKRSAFSASPLPALSHGSCLISTTGIRLGNCRPADTKKNKREARSLPRTPPHAVHFFFFHRCKTCFSSFFFLLLSLYSTTPHLCPLHPCAGCSSENKKLFIGQNLLKKKKKKKNNNRLFVAFLCGSLYTCKCRGKNEYESKKTILSIGTTPSIFLSLTGRCKVIGSRMRESPMIGGNAG